MKTATKSILPFVFDQAVPLPNLQSLTNDDYGG